MNRNIIRILIFVAVFVLLFSFRLYYGYTSSPNISTDQAMLSGEVSSGFSKRNYASDKYVEQSVSVDQKYEKVATAVSRTYDFDSDDGKIRNSVEKNRAIVQYESKTGLTGKRTVVYMIGVPPRLFDSMVDELKTVGTLRSLSINKSDKTNEYRELNARLATLTKTRDSLAALKMKNASVEELIQLENRILEIENEIQGLGVSLGDFDDENEFCTVNFTLIEYAGPGTISSVHRVKVALQWTIKYYALLLLVYFLFIASFNITLSVYKKLSLTDRIKTLFKQ